uniref:Meiotic nuclear division protein 1 homolog n=1 Tax=Ciona intestinalis TaxID=7719 RepID=F6UW27_CIOIN|nr:meiotic nuclear division protein 1 homolog [Ciona intestinalis]|eukprot:XP_026693349.1 meiotic nuclear division protein 1 homolog [Ciona intestinalis]
MSKKRGLSLEEKRTRMLEIFTEKNEFFHLKEIEKLAPKLKGITPMSVKEVLQGLVDDDLVNCEKVGSSSYYWTFSSQALNDRLKKTKKLNDELQNFTKKLASTNRGLAEAEETRKDSKGREELLQELAKLEKEKANLQLEIAKYKECDPEVVNAITDETQIAKESANRWTDNMFNLKSWIKRKFPIDEAVINKQFEIPEELDYVE